MNRTTHRLPRVPLFVALIAATMLLLPADASAQVPDLDEYSSGRSYVIAFPDTASNLMDTTFAPRTENVLSLFIYSAVNNTVRINGRSYGRTVAVRAGEFTVVNLLDSATQVPNTTVTQVGTVSDNTFRVQADEPVVLYCYMMTRFGAETWTPLPVDRWGSEYFAAAVPGEIVVSMFRKDAFTYARRNASGPAQILVISAYDSTRITIYPNGRLENFDRTAVTLNRGQAYLVESWVDTTADRTGAPQVDLGGSRIVGNKPFAVMSGNTRARVTSDRPQVTDNALKNLLIEWLAPTDQYGTDFVWTPTIDTRHLTGLPGERVSEKRTAEFARVYSADDATRVVHTHDTGDRDTATVRRSQFEEYRVLNPRAQRFVTSKPAQVVMHSTGVVKSNGAVSGQPGSQNFDSWGPYMADVVPREQWTTFAPLYAPTSLYDTKHYINVVADTFAVDMIYDENGAPFEFDRGRIPGTPYMWGTKAIVPGRTQYLEGREGTRFYAVQYGLRQGLETYIPEVRGQTFAQYHELIGRSYGMPLAPGRRLRRDPDMLRIDQTQERCGLAVKIRTTNANPVGLLSAAFAPGAVNARVVIQSPTGWNDVAGLSSADLYLRPADPLADASGTLVITDRTGKTWTVPFAYQGERLALTPTRRMDYGELPLGAMKDSVITITNPTDRSVTVPTVQLRSGAQSFSIIATVPALPAVLAPGGQMTVTVRATPASDKNLYRDTLRVVLACAELRLPLQIGPVPPCITVDDLNFDTLDVNQPRTLELQICNDGHGVVSFSNPVGDKMITWLEQNFWIDNNVLNGLKTTRLGLDQCVTIPVTFRSATEGTFETTARLWASTRSCRDTSIWRAVVRRGFVGGVGTALSALGITARPNPLTASTEIRFELAAPAVGSVRIYDAAGRIVGTLVEGRMPAGEHSVVWDAAGYPAGVYYCRVVAGARVATIPLALWR